MIVAGRNISQLSADCVVRFDGDFFTALDAFQNAANNPVLFIVDSTDPAALATIGQARAGGVVTQALIHRSELGPLGRTVLTRIAIALAQQTDPGTVLAVLADIEAQSRTFVLVDSPAKLHRPTPSLWQHAWGLLPGTCFLGELGGRVTAIGRRGLSRGLVDALSIHDSVLYSSGTAELSASRSNAAEQIIEAIAPHQHVSETADASEAAGWWGPARPLELCALPRDIARIAHEVQSAGARCSWCGVTASGPACAVCGSAHAGNPDRESRTVHATTALPAQERRGPATSSITEGQPA